MICPNCGFHNGPDDEFCGSCGQYLWTERPEQATAADPADAADPDALTRTVPANLQRCWNCGSANEATRTSCQSCGEQLRQARTRRWRAVGGSAAGRTRPEVGAQAQSADRTRRRAVIGAAAAVVVVLLLTAAVMSGLLGGNGDVAPGGAAAATGTTNTGGEESAAPRASSAGSTDGSSTAEPNETPTEPTSSGTASGRFRCEPQTITAPAPGRWEVRSVRYGDRAGFDYLTFNLRRRGSADEAGGVTAELVALDEVESRFGFDGPDGGEIALVVRFEGPIGLNGSFGRSVGQRGLREFRLLRHGGVTYAVLGVAGRGCFELRSPDWADGSGANASVTIDIER